MIKRIFGSILLWCGASSAADTIIQDTAFTAPIPFRQLVINGDAEGEFKLLLFLHGAGERGTDNKAQLLHGCRELTEYCKKNKVKAVIIVPQCPWNSQWVEEPWSALSHTMHTEPSAPLAAALEIVEAKKAEFNAAQVYAAGLSMGGYGTWEVISRRPDLFDAALPVCGGGDTAQASKLLDIPILAAHGSVDNVVPVSRSRDMVNAIWNAGGTKIIYWEMPGVDHGCWGAVFSSDRVWNWLFAQKKDNETEEMEIK